MADASKGMEKATKTIDKTKNLKAGDRVRVELDHKGKAQSYTLERTHGQQHESPAHDRAEGERGLDR